MLEEESARIRELSFESMGLTEEFSLLTAMGMIRIRRRANK